MSSQTESLCGDWLRYAKEAKQTGDNSFYKVFLNEVQKTFTKLYADVEIPETISLVETVLKITSCKLRESNIKYK